MRKTFKSFLYIVACAAIFLILVKVYDGSLPSNSASAFEWEKSVNIYVGNSERGSSEDCAKVFPLARTIINAENLGPGSLEALLKGVSEKEKSDGYFTSLNEEVLIQGFEVVEKVAYVDFSSKFNEGVGGSCKVTSIKSQIENTLNNLPNIDSVVISVNGETEGILEP